MPPYTVCITGNIASGKSTLAALLAKRIRSSIYVEEPHTVNPFLPLYLRDRPRWGFTAQLRYYHDYAWALAEARASGNYRYYFVDTGIWTNLHVYARYLAESGQMSADEYDFYWMLCATIQRAYDVPDAGAYIFIDAAPQTCLERMERRGWEYQVGTIDLSYIQTLHLYFDKMARMVSQSTPMLILSGEELDFTAEQGQREALRRVERFLNGDQLAHS